MRQRLEGRLLNLLEGREVDRGEHPFQGLFPEVSHGHQSADLCREPADARSGVVGGTSEAVQPLLENFSRFVRKLLLAGELIL